MTFHLKEVSVGWNDLMHAIKVGCEIVQSLSLKMKQKHREIRNKTSNFV